MERLPGDPRAWSNSTMMPSMKPLLNSTTSDSIVACAECHALAHESEDCLLRKQRETNIAKRAKHLRPSRLASRYDVSLSQVLIAGKGLL